VATAQRACGNDAAARGWIARAGRLLDGAGPCVERGYWELAVMSCELRDMAALALADGGLALVSQGRAADGIRLLDEAMAAVVAGEVRHHGQAGQVCCAIFSAWERLGDLERAAQWLEASEGYARERFGEPPPPVFQTHRHTVYGSLLGEFGRFAEAEAELARALGLSSFVPMRAEATGRLADLRVRQGRELEAAELLAGWEDRIETASALARLHLARDELDLAGAAARRAIAGQTTNRLTCAPLLALLVEIECRRGDRAAAAAAAAELARIAGDTELGGVRAYARLAAARLAAAEGQDPTAAPREALSALAAGERPLLRAELHLQLAIALSGLDPAGAVGEARAAQAIFRRAGARPGADRVAGLLRDLGVSARAGGGARPGLEVLSARERDVLALVAEGLSNADIAARLFISAKTAEHHVSRILGKLGVRSRAEAAAYAAARRAQAPPDPHAASSRERRWGCRWGASPIRRRCRRTTMAADPAGADAPGRRHGMGSEMSTSATHRQYVLGPGEGDAYWFVGQLLTWRRAARTPAAAPSSRSTCPPARPRRSTSTAASTRRSTCSRGRSPSRWAASGSRRGRDRSSSCRAACRTRSWSRATAMPGR